MTRSFVLSTASAMALTLSMAAPAFAQEGGPGQLGEPQGGPPVIEAPGFPVLGSASADGGGQAVQHEASTIGSGPGNDVGLRDSTMDSMNAITSTIEGNELTFEGLTSSEATASLEDFQGTGQVTSSQNAGNQSVVGAGISVNFTVNQGPENGPIIADGAILRQIDVDTTETVDPDGNESTTEVGSFVETAAPDIQTTFSDGDASANGGGRSALIGDEVVRQTHIAKTTASGTGNDTGFSNATMTSSNTLNATITGNTMGVTFGEGGDDGAVALTSAASMTGVNVTGQAAFTQNTGNQSAVNAGTSVTFVSNFTTAPDLNTSAP
jgi:hypothetical protein